MNPQGATADRERCIHCVAILLLTIAAGSSPAQTAGQPLKQWQLWKINVDGTGLARFVDIPGTSCGAPAWSPDGKYLACDAWPVEKNYNVSEIAIIRADGSQPPRLIGLGGMASWSPDGTQIVCHTYGGGGGGSPQIVVMNADGSGREAILDHWGSPRWSPRGNRIASVLNDNIAIFNLATGRERNILHGPYSARLGFCISPDGLRYCFANAPSGLALATLDDRTMQTSVRKLVTSGTCSNSSWSPDGKRVVFSWTPPKLKRQLYLLDVDANEPPRWLPGQDRTRNNTNPTWSPDGKTIVFPSQFPVPPPDRANSEQSMETGEPSP